MLVFWYQTQNQEDLRNQNGVDNIKDFGQFTFKEYSSTKLGWKPCQPEKCHTMFLSCLLTGRNLLRGFDSNIRRFALNIYIPSCSKIEFYPICDISQRILCTYIYYIQSCMPLRLVLIVWGHSFFRSIYIYCITYTGFVSRLAKRRCIIKHFKFHVLL